MLPKLLLHKKVRVWTLPEVQPGPAGSELLVKRVLLPQGELAQFYDGDAGMRYIASIELKTGTVRGNHYHKLKQEYVYVLSGKVLFVFEDLDTRERAEVPGQAGTLVLIEPQIVHALAVKETGLAVEFSPNRFDPNDTYREKLV